MQENHLRTYDVLGMMSGTSLDGLDIAACRFINNKNNWTFDILEAKTIDYPEFWKKSLSNASTMNQQELLELHDEYGSFLGTHALEFISEKKLKTELLASHGHTIFHEPVKGITFQLGNGEKIANLIKLPVVWDFRSQDVAIGGQGAPLVPAGDKLLFGKYEFCLNLGGFSNISYEINNKRIAFDICPVNFILNYLAGEKELVFDKDGEIARKGNLNIPLLTELNNLIFYSTSPPKSLGREWAEKNFLPILEKYKIAVEDKLHTVCEHICCQLAKSVNHFPKGKILVTGGGAMNLFLMELLRKKIIHRIIIPDEKVIHYKEALVFGLLGVLRMNNLINCYATVTGAKHDLSAGMISYPDAQ